MKYVLIWCSEGTITVAIDEKEYELRKNQLTTITSGQIHYFKKLNKAKGIILEFTLDFFCKDDRDIELIFHNGLFCHFDMNEVITAKNNHKIENHLNVIKEELKRKPYQYLLSVHSHLELILTEINRIKIDRGDEIYKPDALFLKFLESVRSNFKQRFPVSHFAEVLQTTELKLNALSKLHTGKTAQNVIYGLIVSEAKRLFTYDNLSVKEVAYELGFDDPFYFSKFFKKHTQQSPKSYKFKVST